jgi:hypothetical protein
VLATHCVPAPGVQPRFDQLCSAPQACSYPACSDPRSSSPVMAPHLASDLFFAPEVDEHRELVKWWTQTQKNPFERSIVRRLMHQWTDDQCRNGALVIAMMRIRALYSGVAAILVRRATIAFSSSRSLSVYTLQALISTACAVVMVTTGLQDPETPDTNPTITAVLRVVFALIGVGSLFLTVIAGIMTAILCHVIWRVFRSLRACGGDVALVYIPPVALLLKGAKLSWRPPFYEPEPFIKCDDPRELARRIWANDFSL